MRIHWLLVVATAVLGAPQDGSPTSNGSSATSDFTSASTWTPASSSSSRSSSRSSSTSSSSSSSASSSSIASPDPTVWTAASSASDTAVVPAAAAETETSLPPAEPVTASDTVPILVSTATVTKTKTEFVTVTGPAEPVATGVENGASIYFPTSSVYWVFNALAMVQWAPPLYTPVDIIIHNKDIELLPYTYALSSRVPPHFASMSVSMNAPCKPGKGFYVTIEDSSNGTVYAQSQIFELKPQDTVPIMPPGVTPMTAVMGAQGNVDGGAGAVRANAWMIAGAAAAASVFWL